MNESHSGRAKVKVITKWLVLVNTYGIRPIVLFIIMNMNREINISVLPGCELGPISVLNVLWRAVVITLQPTDSREGIAHSINGSRISPMNVLVQLS